MGGTANAKGISYGPSPNGKKYDSLDTHRGANPNKSQWTDTVTRDQEFEIFCVSDEKIWCCDKGHYWSVGNPQGTTVLGTKGERLAKFPKTQNDSDPWHGYPVSPRLRGSDDSPSDHFIKQWISAGAISETFGKRLLRCSI